MSPDSYQLFNTWFPAIVAGLIISLVAAALWDLLRRKTWCFASRLWPGILKEVGLDTSSVSRAEVIENQREVTEALSNLSSQITNYKALLPAMADSTSDRNSFVPSKCGVTENFDLEAQIGINPLYSTPSSNSITFLATAYFPDDTPMVVIRPAKKFFKRNAKGIVKRWKSSIILQASLPIDSCVLAEIVDLAKHCMHMEYRCTFQLGNWAILYCNAGEVHLHILKEGDVPVNVEARWQADDRTCIMMRGLYLNGAQVKAATKRTNTILRKVGPAAQGPGELDELHFLIGELGNIPGEDSLLFAAKIVEADGVSLIVRSEASLILPPRQNLSFMIEGLWSQLEWISIFARKLTKSFLTAEDRQADTTANRIQEKLKNESFLSGHLLRRLGCCMLRFATEVVQLFKNKPEMRFDLEHSELILQHWKGVSEIELLENRKKVLHFLHELRQFRIVDGLRSQPPDTQLHFIRDVEYWQKGLQDVNDVILQRRTGRLQSGTHISIRGGLKFLCGDFESALQDLNLAYEMMREHPCTVLVERALVKCMLARYSEALEDVGAVIAINPNENNIQELQTCIEQILDQRTPTRRIHDGPSSCHGPRLSEQDNRMATIPDLLTGDEWLCPGKNILLALYDTVTDHDTLRQRNLGEPLSAYRQVSCRSAMLTKHSSPDGEAEAAARAADAGFDYNNLQKFRFNFRDSPSFVIEIPGDLSDEEKEDFVTKEAHRLASLTEPMPSVAWIPGNWCHCITCPEEVTSSLLWDIGHINDKESTSDSVLNAKANYVQVCDGRSELLSLIKNQWILDSFPPPLMDSASELRDTNFNVKCSTSYGSRLGHVLREIVGSSPEEDKLLQSRRTASRTRHDCAVIQQPFCSCDEELKWNARESLNSDGPVLQESSSIGDLGVPLHQTLACHASTDLVIFPQTVQLCVPRQKESETVRCRWKDWFDSQHEELSGAACQPPEISSDPRSQEGCVVVPARTGSPTSNGTFDIEQAAARSMDSARKLLKFKKKRHDLNFPCEKLEAYSRQILIDLTDLTAPSMFRQVAVFVKHECKVTAEDVDRASCRDETKLSCPSCQETNYPSRRESFDRLRESELRWMTERESETMEGIRDQGRDPILPSDSSLLGPCKLQVHNVLRETFI